MDTELNKIYNLFRFNLNFSRYSDNSMDVMKQSPDYILEKYNHWIGFKPTVLSLYQSGYTKDEFILNIHNYTKVWGNNIDIIKPQLYYLFSTDNLRLLNMVTSFEEYIGPLSMVSGDPKSGLHPIVESKFLPTIIKNQDLSIKKVLRDLKLSTLV